MLSENVKRLGVFVLGRPGNDLLSRVLRHSTIGAEEFNGRVRDGIGFLAPRSNHRTGEEQDFCWQAMGEGGKSEIVRRKNFHFFTRHSSPLRPFTIFLLSHADPDTDHESNQAN